VEKLSDWSMLMLAWAEEVRRLIGELYAVRKEHWDLLAAQERSEDWSPSDEMIARAFRRHWVASHQVVWAAYQLNRWAARDARDSGREVPAADAVLKNLRDALEHLDEAEWQDDVTLGPPPEGAGKNKLTGRALRELPGNGLLFGVGFDGTVLGLVDIDELDRRAAGIIEALDHAEYESVEAEVEHLLEAGWWQDDILDNAGYSDEG
jgi:hypothetical protein